MEAPPVLLEEHTRSKYANISEIIREMEIIPQLLTVCTTQRYGSRLRNRAHSHPRSPFGFRAEHVFGLMPRKPKGLQGSARRFNAGTGVWTFGSRFSLRPGGTPAENVSVIGVTVIRKKRGVQGTMKEAGVSSTPLRRPADTPIRFCRRRLQKEAQLVKQTD